MQNGSLYVLVSETSEEMLDDLQNYDEVYHKHTKNCINIDIDGVCNYRINLKEFVKQKPCSKSAEIIKNSNSNFHV